MIHLNFNENFMNYVLQTPSASTMNEYDQIKIEDDHKHNFYWSVNRCWFWVKL